MQLFFAIARLKLRLISPGPCYAELHCGTPWEGEGDEFWANQ